MSWLPGWPGTDQPEDRKPEEPKPKHARVAKIWVRWMRASLALVILAAATLLLAVWLPYPYAGNLMLSAFVVLFLSAPGFIIATSLWSRVPKEDEAWCTTLGLAEVKEER